MYEHVKTGCKHIPPSEQQLQFQSGYYLNKPRIAYLSMKVHVEVCHASDVGCDCPLSPRTQFAIPSQFDVHAMTIRLMLYNTCIWHRGDPLRRYAVLQCQLDGRRGHTRGWCEGDWRRGSEHEVLGSTLTSVKGVSCAGNWTRTVKHLLHFTGCHRKGLNFILLCITSILPVKEYGLYLTSSAGLTFWRRNYFF